MNNNSTNKTNLKKPPLRGGSEGRFGFKITQPRVIDFDKVDASLYKKLIRIVPSLERCMMCGGCTATCSVNNHAEFNFRKCHLMFRRGQMENLTKGLDKCMLCGKCTIVCPRGVNTRAVIQNMRILLGSTNYERRVSHAVGK